MKIDKSTYERIAIRSLSFLFQKISRTFSEFSVIMTFRSGNIDHAVVVTGNDHDESGNLVIKYRDPTNNTVVRRVEGNYSALYSVGTLYIDSPISGAVDNSVSGLLSGDVYYA